MTNAPEICDDPELVDGLFGIFAAADNLANDLEPVRSDPSLAHWGTFQKTSESRRRLMDGLERIERVKHKIPLSVLIELSALANIVHVMYSEYVTLPDVCLYLAHADLRGPAWRGWHALATAQLDKRNMFSWATNTESLVAASSTYSEGRQTCVLIDETPTSDLPPARDSEQLQELRPFIGGELSFFEDRVELCGVIICRGPRGQARRLILDLLRKTRSDGRFDAYFGEEIASELESKGIHVDVAGAIAGLRDCIVDALRDQANIECGRYDVVLSRGTGYRLANCVTVQGESQTPITDTDGTADVLDVRNHDAGDVPNDAGSLRLEWILQRLNEGHALQGPAVAKQFKCSVKTAQRDLQGLKEEGKIEFIGATRTGHYRLREPR